MTDAGVIPCLLCRVGDLLCAFSMEHIVETMRPLPVEPLPGAPPFVAGVALIRGRPVPVVDVAGLVGRRPNPPARFVTLRVGEAGVALAVDGVVGAVALHRSEMRALPPLLSGAPSETVAGLARLDGELLVVLRSAALVPAGAAAAAGVRGSAS